MTEIKIKNETAFQHALGMHPVHECIPDVDINKIQSMVALYESSITGEKDDYGNDKAIKSAIRMMGSANVAYNFLAEYEQSTNNTETEK